MINIRSIKKLADNEGMTLKYGKRVSYVSGWQVATEGVECKTAQGAIDAVRDFGGNCGVWFSNGIYYIDKSKRVQTKHEALAIGKEHNQLSILGWRTMKLVHC